MITSFAIKPSDYRDAYCGNFASVRTVRYCDAQSKSFISSTNNFTIVISKSSADSMLNIEMQEGVFVTKLRNSKFFDQRMHLFGRFVNDSVYIDFTPGMGPNSSRYIGKK
ncbi:MAG: hypothetical protein JNK50_10495 [Bacteroidia bacterium]|nr:hypothetical protein [Bacteroidia bacterium]